MSDFGSLGKIKVWISFPPWSFLHYWFFMNLQLLTEWKFAFLNTAIIIFCLIYSLNIPHSNQNPSSFSWFVSSLACYLYSYISANDEGATHTNIILTFLSVWFYYCHGKADLCLVLMTNTKYIVCLSFPGSQAKPNWVSKVYQLL